MEVCFGEEKRSMMEYVCEGEGDRWKGKRPRSRDKEVRCA